MFDDDEENDDRGWFLLVLGVLLVILLVVTVVAISGDELPEPTVTGDVPEETVPEVVETTTTTEDPAPEETTTEAPTTTEEEVALTTMWEALNESGEAGLFASLAGQLGLQADLEATEDDDGSPVERTLFAPSDEAIGDLTPEAISELVADTDAAIALVGYHFLEGRYTFEDLQALDGQTIESRTGQLISFANDGDSIVINGVSRVTSGDFDADNGIVHVVDTILDPPDNVNELLGLENIEFEVASANITAESQEELQRAVDFFATNEEFAASIEGHTDTDGSADANLALSQARADAVLDFLVTNGIDADRLTATGFGETDPILVDGVEDKAASRRIEFIVDQS